MMIFPVGTWVHGSQQNGIVYFGKVIGHVRDDMTVLQYWHEPDDDPPRRPYRVERNEHLRAGFPCGKGWPADWSHLVPAE